jgi:hypothetical protein
MQTLLINDASMKEAELAWRHITISHHMQGMIYALYALYGLHDKKAIGGKKLVDSRFS